MNTPFRVMCVKADSRDAVTKEPLRSMLFVGNEYTVESISKVTIGEFFELRGFPNERFASRLFAILPDASADQMQEAERESIVNIETVLV